MREHQSEPDIHGGKAGRIEDQHQDAGHRAGGDAEILTSAERKAIRQARDAELCLMRREGATWKQLMRHFNLTKGGCKGIWWRHRDKPT